MSVVTNLMLSCSVWDGDDRVDGSDIEHLCPALQHVRRWCIGEGEERDRDRIGFPDKDVDAVSAGTKHMEVHVYAWGANYLDLAGFLAAVAAAPWRKPERVQVFAQGQDDDLFRVWTLRRDRTWSYYDPEKEAELGKSGG